MIRDTSAFFFAIKATVVLIVFYNHFRVKAFAPTTLTRSTAVATATAAATKSSTTPLFAGMGMGMGGATKSKKKGGKNKSKNKGSNKGKGLSSPASSSTPFDVNSSIIRLEKKYDELMRDAAKNLQREEEEANSYSSWSSGEIEPITSEYVVAARRAASSTSSAGTKSVLDWVPIAQLCLKRPETEFHDGASDELVQTAVSVYCRELSFLAAAGAPVFATMARNEIQYSVESVDSFHKYVYDEVVEGKATKSPDQAMTKAQARETLGIEADTTDKADIKKAYRRLSFELHPDRFEGTPEECEAATARFGRVQLAYDTLSSGVREEGVSWYESLGGKERTGFVGPVNLLPMAAAKETMTRKKAEGALCGLDPVMVQSFVARHLRSA